MAAVTDPMLSTRREALKILTAGSACAAVGLLVPGCTGKSAPGPAATSSTPRRGGTLRVGTAGGSAKDTIDAHSPLTHPDEARVIQLYDTLTGYDADFQVQMALAESMEPSANARQWTIRLRSGLEFSDGKTVTSQDVAFSLRRIIDPSDPKYGAASLSAVGPNSMVIVDARTLRLDLTQPESDLPSILANYAMGIVPTGYNPRNPVGAGPFKFQSFTPGRESVFTRHPNYWRSGEPYLDQVTILDFVDDAARVNALLSGQVDAIDQVPAGQIGLIQANQALRILESQTGSWLPFVMRTDAPPFNDERVRQAFRLIVDREQMVNQAIAGHGTIGNDVYGRFDPAYDSSLPQRHQDIEQAKRLLQQSGRANLGVELVTSSVAAGLVESAQVFQSQAKLAGVQVSVRKVDPSEFFGPNYLKWNFAQDFWFTRNYLEQATLSSLPSSPLNETHWSDPQYTRLVMEARATVDQGKRTDLIRQAQTIDYEKGGYIIWSFPNQVDAYSAKVSGFVPDRSGIPLTSYGFRQVWFDS